jgi:hypothetical protein
MDVEILDFVEDQKGARMGYLDIKVTHGIDKTEIFRNLVYFEKENRKWLDIGNVSRNGQWIKRYDREPSIKPILEKALKLFEQSEHSRGN